MQLKLLAAVSINKILFKYFCAYCLIRDSRKFAANLIVHSRLQNSARRQSVVLFDKIYVSLASHVIF